MLTLTMKRKLKVMLAVILLLILIYFLLYERKLQFRNYLYFAPITKKHDVSIVKDMNGLNKYLAEDKYHYDSLRTSSSLIPDFSEKDLTTQWIIRSAGIRNTTEQWDQNLENKKMYNKRNIKFFCQGRLLDDVEDIFHVPEVNCRKLLSGDRDEMVYAQNFTKTMNRSLLSEQFYLNLTTNCELFQRQRGYIMCPLTSEEENFPIAFSMLVYKDVEMVERLLRSIYRPQNYYCIHVDQKSDEQFFSAVLAIASCFENVFLAPERVKVSWGLYSVLKPELICMKHLWKYRKWKYFINLTGQEFPLKTNLEIVQILKAYKGANNVDGTIKRDFVDYILHNQTAKDLLDWVKTTQVPDETYFAMLNHNPQLGIRGSYKGIPETEPDNSTVKPFLTRFKNWGFGNNRYPCAGHYVRGICILTTGDLPVLGKAKHLFANKFYLREDPIVIGCLEEMIFNNTRDEFKGDKQFNTTYYSQLGFVVNRVQ